MWYNGSMNRKEYLRVYQKAWIAKRRTLFFENKCCVQCGSKEKLELDHIDPKNKISNAIWSWAEKRRIVELKKCQVLCEKCHKKKTKLWWESRRKHGRTMYKYGCRCKICFTAQQKHNAQRNMPF